MTCFGFKIQDIFMNEQKEMILFGQFLKKYSELKINDDIIANVINTQREECRILGIDCRKFGMILLEDFEVFRDEKHLEEYLEKFQELKKSLGLNVDPIDDHFRTKME